MKTTKSNDTCEVDEYNANDLSNDLHTLRSDPHGSDELLDAIERLLDAKQKVVVDEVLKDRFGESEEETLKDRLQSEGEKCVRVTKGRAWMGIREHEGQRRKDLTRGAKDDINLDRR